jgi:tryptophan 2,3-dioxygenase
MEFRDILGPSSGFQSLQYRTIEFLLGNKNAAMLRVFAHDPEGQAGLRRCSRRRACTTKPCAYLARHGYAGAREHLDRDWSQPHSFSPDLVPVFETIYEGTAAHWEAYHLCEDLVDLESQFQLWRFRHMRTVMRIIGFKKGREDRAASASCGRRWNSRSSRNCSRSAPSLAFRGMPRRQPEYDARLVAAQHPPGPPSGRV